MRAAGLPLEELPGPQVMPVDLAPAQRAERGLALLRAGFVGEKNGAPRRDPEGMALLFDTLRRSVDPQAGPLVLQWEFEDAEPWHLRLADGAAQAVPGRAPDVDLELRCRFEDWVDVMAGRLTPGRALATRRLRPHGSPRALWASRRLFAA
jgi:hypothetical protein